MAKKKLPRIVATAPVDDIVVEILSEFGHVEIAPDVREETLLGMLEGTAGIVVRGEGRVSSKVIQEAKDLVVIGRTGVGYECIDIQAATARGIPVVYTPGAGARAVAEGALAMLLSSIKQLPRWDQAVKSGNWDLRYQEKCRDMATATLGIVGLGQIGSDLAHLVQPFGMNVIATDPYVDKQKANELDVELVSLAELFQRADYISLHTLLNEETRGMINRNILAKIKPGAILVNTSRGGIIENLDVLHEALQDGRLAGVCLDVFPVEPLTDPSHPIFKHSCCQVSPHAIGMSYVGMERIFRSMAEDMAAVFRGQIPKNVVNPQVCATSQEQK